MLKKSLSDIIATVLIVMLTIAAASILFFFIVPWIKDMLADTKACSSIQPLISVVEGKYTCHTQSNTSVMLKINLNEIEVSGFAISLVSAGSGKSYTITNNSQVSGVSMFNHDTILIMPDKGGSETYIFDISSDSVEVAPILANGKTCSSIKVNLRECS